MAIELETPRLVLKQFCDDDIDHLFELNSDFDVVKYTGDAVNTSPEDVLPSLERSYHQYEHYKSGRLSVFDKQTGEYLGWCGLRYFPESGKTDIGYRFHKRHWGKGYATESSLACLNYGFNGLNLEEIIGTAMKENKASIRVFEKLGLKYSHDDNCGCQPGVVYKIKKEEWK